MWRSSDHMNNSLLEDNECNSSEVINSRYDDLKIGDSLDISLYENTSTEPAICDNDNSFRIHSLGSYASSSKESGYNSSEYLTVHEDKNDSFCDHVSSIGLNEPLDEEIFDFCKTQKADIQLELPMDFNMLLDQDLSSKAIPIKTDTDTPKLTLYKRSKAIKRSLSNSNDDVTTDKQLKTLKASSSHSSDSTHSEIIKMALQRSITDPNLTGDFSKACYLPLTSGRHQDLKSITPSTMCSVVKGEFSQDITFKIIDCRYPYEYDGGHIEGAINLYTKDMLINTLLNKSALKETKSIDKRFILIFHCEFSSNRAPTLYRYLREFDRNYNEHLYPNLFYPEIYLLDGGYKEFYLNYSSLCLPTNYIPMSDPKYNKELSYFREKTKFNTEQNTKGSNKRLDFL